jgi:hypothetical protein
MDRYRRNWKRLRVGRSECRGQQQNGGRQDSYALTEHLLSSMLGIFKAGRKRHRLYTKKLVCTLFFIRIIHIDCLKSNRNKFQPAPIFSALSRHARATGCRPSDTA